MKQDRRRFLAHALKLGGLAAAGGLPPSIARALAVPAHRRTGTIRDVEHVVILMQENRSFDHYFGTLGGVRGFGDPFPIPVADARGRRDATVWLQPNAVPSLLTPVVAPFHLNTTTHFEYTRVQGTPHTWRDAQAAWANGLMNEWTLAKKNHSMGYYAAADLPFQWALANAFTICDAYHCSIQAGTNPNRLFHWTGTNDPSGRGHGPATYNEYDNFDNDPGGTGGYAWTTYPERLEAAGVTWQVYERMDDNFTDNPLAGFRAFRDAWFERPGHSAALRARGVSTRDLDLLAADVRANRLPQVSWIVATAEGSEHPGPSSPAQGADYTARVLDALTASPDVWSKTVLLVNFDENDGFFDHVPPPAPPSDGRGASTVDTAGEYHERLVPYKDDLVERSLLGRPYGLGPRVPLYVVSPWSKGGWVSSEVFDHTSVLRFLAARFGVEEPNISPWRRAVCGDLTSAFDFATPDALPTPMPDTAERAVRARALPGHTTPPLPREIELPVQHILRRPSRPTPYILHADSHVSAEGVRLTFASAGAAGAVLHVYDRKRLSEPPRRYTVGAGDAVAGTWPLDDDGAYDLWVLGPNGFHRHFAGRFADGADAWLSYEPSGAAVSLVLANAVAAGARFRVGDAAHEAPPTGELDVRVALPQGPWYDLVVTVEGRPGFGRRFAGRIETGRPSFSDPGLGEPARVRAFQFPGA